jgi:adenine-specific DNA-methyltransferase
LIPKEKQLLLQQVRALQPLVSGTSSGAKRLTETVLHLWQSIKFPSISSGGPTPDKTLLRDPRVTKLAQWLASKEFFDGAFWLSSAYATWVGNDVRSSQSLYFTPPELANRLIADLVTNKASLTKHVWIDPACGGAAFLAPVARHMANALRKEGKSSRKILEHIAMHLLGNDLDPALAALSNQFLRMALSSEIEAARWEPLFQVSVSDGLSGLESWHGQVDVVICNPPYRKMKSPEVATYRFSFDDVIQGQPNIYSLFFKQALRMVRTGGIAGLLTPTSFLCCQDFSKLRIYLLTHADMRQLDIVRNREGVFIGVTQETAITILKPRKSKQITPAETKVFLFDKTEGFKDIGHCTLPNSGLAWPVPRSIGDAEAIRSLTGPRHTLIDYGYETRIGTYVDYRDPRATYATEKAGMKALALFPLVWSSDIIPTGGFEHGRVHKNNKNRAFIDMRESSHSSVIRRPCVALQRVTSSDQPRRLVASPVDPLLIKKHGGVVGENHVVFLQQASPAAALTPQQLSDVLRSEPIDRLFRCISGAVNVSVFELNQLPLPSPEALRKALKKYSDINEAVRQAFKASSN